MQGQALCTVKLIGIDAALLFGLWLEIAHCFTGACLPCVSSTRPMAGSNIAANFAERFVALGPKMQAEA